MNTFYSTQLGYTPSGSAYGSQIILGRNLDTTWEAIGFGQAGRPDVLERVVINLTRVSGVATPTKLGQISFNVTDIQTLIAGSTTAASGALNMQLREIDVCNDSTAMKMLGIFSSPYVR